MKLLLMLFVTSVFVTACGVEGENNDDRLETSDGVELTDDIEETVEISDNTSNTAKKQSVQKEKPKTLEFDFSDKRESAYEAVETFLEVVVNEDSKERADYEIRKERREELQPVVTKELLKEFEPTDEELIEQGFPIPTDDKEYDETVSPVHNLMEQAYILEDYIIYIDEASIATDTVHVIADAYYTYKTDFMDTIDEYDELSIYKFTLDQQSEELIIIDYEILENGRLKPEEERFDYSEFYR